MLSSPKGIVIAVVVLAVAVISVLGGALGAGFGFGFIGGTVPVIQIPSELVATIGGYQLVNTVLMFGLAIIVLLIITWLATRSVRQVPGRWQALMEIFYEFFINLAESAGGKRGRMFLPVATAIFLVVLFSNWLGVLPVVGTIGRVETTEEWFYHKIEAYIASHEVDAKLVDEFHHEVQHHHDLAVFLEGHASNADLQHVVSDMLSGEYGEQDFVVFDGTSGPRILPFGRGESSKLSFAHIVAYDLDVGHLDANGMAKIADRLHAGNPPPVQPTDEEWEGTEAEYQALIGNGQKRVGLLVPYLRGSSTDLNMTLAVAIFAMISVQVWGFRALGFKGYMGKFFFNPVKAPIDFFVGILEAIGEFIKVISFTFRLFGNMFAGEVLLIAMGFLFPLIGMIPFIGLELFVGFIQAIIFSVLTLMFGAFAIIPHHHPEHDDHHGGEGAHG